MLNIGKKAELTPARQRGAERDSILSACCGALGDVTLTDSAVIILYAGMLGASDMFSMITTALMPLFNGLCIIPMAYLATRLGNQGIILRACAVSFLAYLAIVAAPFFPSIQVPMLILMLVLFSLVHTGYVAGWFPLLDSFLTRERRSSYLGRMRFSWQLSAAGFLFLVSLVIGKNPPLAHLQLVLLFAAVIYAGRMFFIARIPLFEKSRPERFSFREGLAIALANKPLTGYSVYLFVLNLAAYGTIPLVTIYLKRHLGAPDNIIVLISSVTLGGMLLGSLCAGKIITRFGIKRSLLAIHIIYGFVNICLFLTGKHSFSPTTLYVVITLLLLIYSFTFANANVASTSEMMALATPGNKTMAMAFCGTFYYTGSGMSRLITSLILGSGMLAAEWSIGSTMFSHYQTLFLIYSVAILFAAMLLVVVPAVFPKGEYVYSVH